MFEKTKKIASPLRTFERFVIWGLRKQVHSHRFIHQHFYATLRKLDLPVV
jgi:hypothetical protein